MLCLGRSETDVAGHSRRLGLPEWLVFAAGIECQLPE
jgi:hypothetical protein